MLKPKIAEHPLTFSKLAVFFIALFSCNLLYADNIVQLKPKLCIKKKAADFCDITVDIHWQADKIDHYCVVNTVQNKQLGCWPESNKGETSDQAHTQVDLIYVLLNEENDKAIASQALSILSLEGDSQNRPRRRRHIWSLF